MQETTLSFVKVPQDLDADGIAGFYCKITNQEYRKESTIYSKYLGQLAPMLVDDTWIKEIQGQMYVFIQRTPGVLGNKEAILEELNGEE